MVLAYSEKISQVTWIGKCTGKRPHAEGRMGQKAPMCYIHENRGMRNSGGIPAPEQTSTKDEHEKVSTLLRQAPKVRLSQELLGYFS